MKKVFGFYPWQLDSFGSLFDERTCNKKDQSLLKNTLHKFKPTPRDQFTGKMREYMRMCALLGISALIKFKFRKTRPEVSMGTWFAEEKRELDVKLNKREWYNLRKAFLRDEAIFNYALLDGNSSSQSFHNHHYRGLQQQIYGGCANSTPRNAEGLEAQTAQTLSRALAGCSARTVRANLEKIMQNTGKFEMCQLTNGVILKIPAEQKVRVVIHMGQEPRIVTTSLQHLSMNDFLEYRPASPSVIEFRENGNAVVPPPPGAPPALASRLPVALTDTIEEIMNTALVEPEAEVAPEEATVLKEYVSTSSYLFVSGGIEIRPGPDGPYYVDCPPASRWLCVDTPPNPNLLNYSHQPRGVGRGEQASNPCTHRIGLEVEFDNKYTREIAIKNDQDRPLTPQKVLRDLGWAICSDSSVPGGELKSPILYFNRPEAILEQIPKPIQDFINRTTKGNQCGGHLNYSSNKLNTHQVMMFLTSWSFVFPVLFPDRCINRFCPYKRPDQLDDHYQWAKVKPQCVEVRVFPGYWDVENITHRASLMMMMVSDDNTNSRRIHHCTNYDRETVEATARENWHAFCEDPEHPIKRHVLQSVGSVNLDQIVNQNEFKGKLNQVLNLGLKNTQEITIKYPTGATLKA